MEYYKNIVDKIEKAYKQLIKPEDLLHIDFKMEFKTLMIQAGDIAILLENMNEKSNISLTNKEILDFSTEKIFQLYDISISVLQNLLEFAGFEEKQISQVIKNCKNKTKAEDQTINHLFESTSQKVSLIHYSKNKNILKQNQNIQKEYDNSFDAFIRYIIQIETPSIILEQIAKLSIYQEQQFEKDLNNFVKLKEIYQKFIDNGKIDQKDIVYAKNIIYSSMLKNLNDYPIRITNQNQVPVAKIEQRKEKYHENFITSRSPGSYFDAWGVKDKKLVVYCVTNNVTYENQDIQLARNIYALSNGLKQKTLKDIENFEVIAFCRPLLSNDHKEFKNFNDEANQLVEENTITQEEYDALKFAPIDKEILKIIHNTSDHLYNEIKEHASLGFHSENIQPVRFKEQKEQVLSSIENIHKAIHALNEIRKNNKTLNLIDTAFSTYAKDLTEAYSLAHATFVLYGENNEKIKDSLKQSQQELLEIKKSLITTHSRIASQIIIAKEDDDIIIETKKIHNENYEKEQKELLWNIEQPVVAEKKLNIMKNHVFSLILRNKSNTMVSEALLEEVLLSKIEFIEEKQNESKSGNIHKGSYRQLKEGLLKGIQNEYNLEKIFEEIKIYPDLQELIMNDTDLVQIHEKIQYKNVKKSI
jgi:hypothetical protein